MTTGNAFSTPAGMATSVWSYTVAKEDERSSDVSAPTKDCVRPSQSCSSPQEPVMPLMKGMEAFGRGGEVEMMARADWDML